MSEDKKNRYTPAQAKAVKKYLSESVEDIKIRVPKGKKAYYKEAAKASGESLNSLIIRALDKLIEEEKLG